MGSGTTVAIASDMDFRHAGEVYRGVVDYLASRRLDWRLVPVGHGFETTVAEMLREGVLGGMIGTFISDRWLESFLSEGVRAVNLSPLSDIRSVPTVSPDDRRIGREAAVHLRAVGCRSFVTLGLGSLRYMRERLEGFREEMAAVPSDGAKRSAARSPVELKGNADLRSAAGTLAGMEKPVGVFCADDRLARRLVQELRGSEGAVGTEIRLLGAGDDPAESIFAGVELSSFALPHYGCGWRAAELLARLLDGRGAEGRRHHVDGVTLRARASSIGEDAGGSAARAEAYFREHLASPSLAIGDAARTLGQSRRSLELRFREQFGTSPHAWITEQRLERAKALLTQTDLRVLKIGERCGWPRQHHFSALFKRNTGYAPRDFRALHR